MRSISRLRNLRDPCANIHICNSRQHRDGSSCKSRNVKKCLAIIITSRDNATARPRLARLNREKRFSPILIGGESRAQTGFNFEQTDANTARAAPPSTPPSRQAVHSRLFAFALQGLGSGFGRVSARWDDSRMYLVQSATATIDAFQTRARPDRHVQIARITLEQP